MLVVCSTRVYQFARSFHHLLTHSVIHSLIQLHTHSLTHSLTPQIGTPSKVTSTTVNHNVPSSSSFCKLHQRSTCASTKNDRWKREWTNTQTDRQTNAKRQTNTHRQTHEQTKKNKKKTDAFHMMSLKSTMPGMRKSPNQKIGQVYTYLFWRGEIF